MKKARVPLVAALVAAFLGLLQINSELLGISADLTFDRRHSLSDATIAVLRSVDQPLSVTYYVTDELQTRFPEPDRIADLLLSYGRASETVSVRVVTVDSAQVERESLPLTAQRFTDADGDEQRVLTVYSGIVVSYLDRRSSIPFLFDSRDLEYRLTTLIRGLTLDSLPVVGVLSPEGDQFADATLLASELEAVFTLARLRPGEPVLPGIAALVVLDAHHLTAAELFPVVEFVRDGGSALLFAEAATVALDGALSVEASDLSVLNGVLEEFGIAVREAFVLDTESNALPVQVDGPTGPENQLVDYPLWPRFRQQNTDQSHPVTARFSGLDLYWAAAVQALFGHPARPQPLVATSPSAWLMGTPLRADPNERRITEADPESRGQYAVVVESQPAGGGRLIVIGDTDLASDILIESTASFYNVEFLVQSVQYIANEPDLLALRSRSIRDLTLSGVDDGEAAIALERFAIITTSVVVPFGALFVGWITVTRRSRRRHET